MAPSLIVIVREIVLYRNVILYMYLLEYCVIDMTKIKLATFTLPYRIHTIFSFGLKKMGFCLHILQVPILSQFCHLVL